jgi:tetratricopeptide (TPR) repeat protein
VKPAPEVETLYAEATAAYSAKDFGRALPLYDRVLELQPEHVEAYYKRGNTLKDLGRLAEALSSYDEAIARKPDFAHAWCNRGVVQQLLSLHDGALESYARAITLDPADAFAHANCGALLQQLARWPDALASYDCALALDPQLFQAWFHRGNVLRELTRFTEALASYDEALRLKPDYAEALYNRGVLLERAKQPQAALASYDRALAVYPEFYQAHYNRAGLLKESGELQEALAAYDRAHAVNGSHAETLANRAVVLQELGRLDAALAGYDRAIAIRADYAEAHFNRGTLLRQLAQLDAALASFDRAIAIRPDYAEAHFERACVLLSRGDYARGWPLYEWRWKCANRFAMGEERHFLEPLWLGETTIAGKRLLIHSEQGLGDTLQFCRFAKLAADLGAVVILEVQPPLEGLLRSLDGVSELVVRGARLPRFDYQCPLMSLPLALRTTLETLPRPTRYLHSDPAKVAAWRARLGDGSRPRIGLAWSGNSTQNHDRFRSLRLAALIPHLPREFEYFCVQKDIRTEDQATLAANPWIQRWTGDLNFSETAALCECLDKVISVCTSIAHLSGALGRPTWVLLPFNAEWRWLQSRDDSPWYPTAKLYRQPSFGDWNGVLARLAGDLREALPRGRITLE